ncbi:uncharacterized protein K02A2.6-like [Aphidius gifuensis]|uniref:uncharacterized protein K02A2.6-like n=1 Tax=Aphidius gifuensis TaxID=684658 RepID=UPI001CDB7B3E|nr:uncharacterized protein K02A2.6-like [Aphidius gifuensis]
MANVGFDGSLRPPPPLDLKGSNDLHITWKNWKKKFENYLEAAGFNATTITDKRRVAILINLLGDDAMEIYNTFVYDTGEKDDVLKDVLQKFENYCLPKVNQTVERFNFFQITQQEGENFDSFVTKLRTAAVTCDFGEQKDSLIRDRVICCIRDSGLQRRLLRESEITLSKVVEMCRINEISERQVKVLQETADINALKKRTERKQNTERSSSVSTNNENKFECKRCGYSHLPRKCPAYGKTCNKCKGNNHFFKVCKKSSVNEVQEQATETNSSDEYDANNFFIAEVSKNNRNKEKAWYVDLKINGENVKFKLDTGAEVNIITKKLLDEMNINVKSTRTTLTSFGEFTVQPMGEVNLMCERESGLKRDLNFVVVDVTSMPLLGLQGCQELELVKRIDSVGLDRLQQLIEREYKEVFQGVGTLPFEYSIKLMPNAKPVVHPPRKVPFAIQPKLKDTLNELETSGIISKVDKPTEWVNSLVIVEKKDGSLRLCLDPSNLNKYIMREHFKMSTTEDIAVHMNGMKIFSVLDMRNGFWQVKLDEKSADMCTFNTPFGRYRFLKLPFGICSAPEVFQKRVLPTFGDIEGVFVVVDDLIIAAKTVEEHDKAIKKVFERAKQNNVKFNKNKMRLRLTEVPYVGHIVSKDGLKIDMSKVKSIVNMDEPTNKDELRRFLGMVNYLSRYIPNMSILNAPLRLLLKEENEWMWESEQKEAVKKLKDKLTTAPVLAYYDCNKPIVIQTDASKNGLGAALIQESHPVAYASRSLTETEQRYAPIEKELLAIVFGVERFHQYVYGRQITIHTDHKPLVTIVKKDINKVSGRMQLMLLKIMKYRPIVQYVPGKEMFLADTLSRAFLRDPVQEDTELNAVIHSVSRHLAVSDQKKKAMQAATLEDEVLQRLIQYQHNGWPEYIQNVNHGVRSYWNYRQDISVDDGLVFVEDKLVVPATLRQEMLKIVHEGHLGEEKCKKNARSVLFWPGMTNEIEVMVSSCSVCQQFRHFRTKEPMIPHEIPLRPWAKVGTDILEFAGRTYLVVIDYYSKWLELLPMKFKTANEVIYKLKEIFSRLGVPEELVSDNMPYNSMEFKKFGKEWDIKLTTSSPRYPKSNGLAERAVQISKNILRRASTGHADIFTMLLDYRNTPVKGMSVSPAQLCAGRRFRTKIPVLSSKLTPKVPTNVKQELLKKQTTQKIYYDKTARELPQLNVGDKILLKQGKSVEPAKVIAKHDSPRSFIVTTPDGGEYRRNRSHLVKPKYGSVDYFVDPESLTNDKQRLAKRLRPTDVNDPKGPSLRPRRDLKPPSRFNDFILDK